MPGERRTELDPVAPVVPRGRDGWETYRRPPIPEAVYLDDEGAVIHYGNRWGMASPPQWAYSQEAHPQRWLPLLDVANALITHLEVSFEVSARRDGDTVTYNPPDGCAPLRIQIDTQNVAVRVWAGTALASCFPGCGCDACDDDVLDVIDGLEKWVAAVTSARCTERFDGRVLTTSTPDGTSEGQVERKERKQLRELFDHAPKKWSPWPPRIDWS